VEAARSRFSPGLREDASRSRNVPAGVGRRPRLSGSAGARVPPPGRTPGGECRRQGRTPGSRGKRFRTPSFHIDGPAAPRGPKKTGPALPEGRTGPSLNSNEPSASSRRSRRGRCPGPPSGRTHRPCGPGEEGASRPSSRRAWNRSRPNTHRPRRVWATAERPAPR